ncbi:MAG: segregation and condensation protein A [Acidimicrobiales bacterium]
MDKMEAAIQVGPSPDVNGTAGTAGNAGTAGTAGNVIACSVVAADSTFPVVEVRRPSDRMAGKPADNPARKFTGERNDEFCEELAGAPCESAAEGPLEVLERIVAEHPADLYDIPLSDIVDGFMAELSSIFHVAGRDERSGVRIEPADLDRLSEFLLLASTLLEWKSRLLLASDDEPELDEELYALEERDKLIGRFMELQVYAQVAQSLSFMMEKAALSIPRAAGLEERFATLAPDLLAGVDADMLCRAFAKIQDRASSAGVEIDHVTVDKVSVAETIITLEHRLKALNRTTFRDLTDHLSERMDIIVHFLAILELYKRGMVALSQAEIFGDLDIEWTAASDSDLDTDHFAIGGGSDDSVDEDASSVVAGSVEFAASVAGMRDRYGRIRGITDTIDEYDG